MIGYYFIIALLFQLVGIYLDLVQHVMVKLYKKMKEHFVNISKRYVKIIYLYTERYNESIESWFS